MVEQYFNLPLTLGVVAIFVAQAFKVPIHYVATKEWDFSLLFTTGGMPSSHSAGVMAVATSVGIEVGFSSPIFAVAAMLAGIVMYDATGIRYHAGQQANTLNLLRTELKALFEQMKHPFESSSEQLKTSLGHKRIEVLIGGLLGVLLPIIVYAMI